MTRVYLIEKLDPVTRKWKHDSVQPYRDYAPRAATRRAIPIEESAIAPCGWCRRCAIHDDPGGCLEVEAAYRKAVEAAYPEAVDRFMLTVAY